MNRFSSAFVLLLAASGCGRQAGAVRVVVSFADFEPGCLEVSAADVAGGDAELIQLDGEELSGGRATVGVAPNPAWSKTLKLRVRSFEKTCLGVALEEFSEERTLEQGAVTEWQVTLTARDGDGDGFAAAAAGVNGGDCDDTAATINAGATEECGAFDSDCDGLVGCLDPQCEGRACDDGNSSSTGDLCTVGGGCTGRIVTDCLTGTFVTQEPTPTNDRVCAACPSGSFTAVINAPSCLTWSDCVPGQRVSVPPSSVSDRTCVPCDVGTYNTVSNSSACAPAGTCAPGTAPSVPATMTMPVQCVACIIGTYCAGGLADPAPCGNGTWDDDANPASVCAPWTQCAPGSAVSTAGSATTNTSCSTCAVGNYCAGMLAPLVACGNGTWDHDASSATACIPWTSCAPGTGMTAAGNSTTDTGCAACPNGNYCPGGTTASTPCTSGTWDDDASSATACVAWAQCAAGTSVITAGSATSNRTCAQCSAGTFSSMANAPSCTTWTTCTPGQFVATPGSLVADQACSACPSDTFASSSNSASCLPWSTCSADTYQSVAPTSSSNRVCANYTSCLDRLTRVSTTPSGPYLIDPDGTGALPAITVTCDMVTAPGGWTVIGFDDFTTTSAGWSVGTRDQTSNCFLSWGEVLGGYNNFGSGVTTLKIYNFLNITHTQARVSLDYFIIDSWDAERPSVILDGTQLFNTQFTHGGGNICGSATFGDRGRQAVVGTPAHTTNLATLTISSNLNEAAGNESWAIDNVSVMIR